MRSFARGIGLPGGVWEAARPLWIADIMADEKFLRRQCVRSLGLHAALGFPILVRGEVAGIMEFFARDIRQPAADVEALHRCLYALADYAWADRAAIAEIDLNPIKVLPRGQGCVVVDALIVPRQL